MLDLARSWQAEGRSYAPIPIEDTIAALLALKDRHDREAALRAALEEMRGENVVVESRPFTFGGPVKVTPSDIADRRHHWTWDGLALKPPSMVNVAFTPEVEVRFDFNEPPRVGDRVRQVGFDALGTVFDAGPAWTRVLWDTHIASTVATGGLVVVRRCIDPVSGQLEPKSRPYLLRRCDKHMVSLPDGRTGLACRALADPDQTESEAREAFATYCRLAMIQANGTWGEVDGITFDHTTRWLTWKAESLAPEAPLPVCNKCGCGDQHCKCATGPGLPPGYVYTGDRLTGIYVIGASTLADKWKMAYADGHARFTLTRAQMDQAIGQLVVGKESPRYWDVLMVRYVGPS